MSIVVLADEWDLVFRAKDSWIGSLKSLNHSLNTLRLFVNFLYCLLIPEMYVFLVDVYLVSLLACPIALRPIQISQGA